MSSNPAVVIGVTAVDKASGVLKSLDSQVLGTTSKIEQSSTQASKTTEKASNSMIRSYAGIAASVASLGAGIVSFATSFSTLEKAQNRVDQANLSLERSQAKLERMQNAGTYTAEQLAIAQEDVRVKSEQLRLTQGDLADTTMNFYAQMPAQLISFGSSAVLAFSMYTGGTKVATAGTKVLNFAIKGLQLALGPIGWAIIGVTTLVTLLATNTFGLRDAFVSAGKVIFEFIELHLKPLADFIKWVIDGFNALGAGLDNTQKAYGETSEAAAELTNTTTQAGTAIAKTTQELQTYQDFLVKTEQAILETTTENYHYLDSLGAVHNLQKLTNEQIDLTAEFLRDQQSELKRTKQDNFSLVASYEGLATALALSNDELTKWANGLRLLKQQADEAKDAIEKLEDTTSEDKTSDRYKSQALLEAIDKYGSDTKLVRSGSKFIPLENRIYKNTIGDLADLSRKFGGATLGAIKRLDRPNDNINIVINEMPDHFQVSVSRHGSASRNFRINKRSIA